MGTLTIEFTHDGKAIIRWMGLTSVEVTIGDMLAKVEEIATPNMLPKVKERKGNEAAVERLKIK